MLIIALVLATIGLAALVFAVVTSNALVAWVCIGASLLGVLLLIVDALRERRRLGAATAAEPVVADSRTASDDGDVDPDALDQADGGGVDSESPGTDSLADDASGETAEEEEPATQSAD